MDDEFVPTILDLVGAAPCVVPWTSAALLAQIRRFDLSPWGVPPKARVGLLLPSGTVNAVGLLSALAWYCVVPISPMEPTLSAASKLEGSRARVVIAFEGNETAAAVALSLGLPLIALRLDAGGGDGAFTMPPPPTGAAARANPDAREPISGEDNVLILHTSGTTGKSKRVLFSLRRLVACGRALADSMALQPADVGYNVMPLHHVGGIACNLMCPLVSRSKMLFRRRHRRRRRR